MQGGGVATEETGVGPYPKVYDLMALDERTRSAVLGKYGRMHVNSAEDGTDIDEVMTVVSGGPFRWGFTLKDGSIARFQIDKVGLEDKAVRISYHGLGMHAGLMDAKQGLLVAFAHGPRAFTMRYQADVPHAQLLGTNPWADVGITLPPPRQGAVSRCVPSGGGARPLPPAFMPAVPSGRGARGPSPLFRLRLCRARHARRAMIRAGLPRAALCLAGMGVDTPGIRTIVIKCAMMAPSFTSSELTGAG